LSRIFEIVVIFFDFFAEKVFKILEKYDKPYINNFITSRTNA